MNDLLLSEDELLLRTMVRGFADQVLAPHAAYHDETGEFPVKNVQGLAKLGLFGLTIGEKYGGSGGSTRQLVIAAEEIARGCGSTSVIYLTHLSLCSTFIQLFGSEQQKQRILPPLVKAKTIGAFALTEPGSGSDAASLSTTGILTNGQYSINGVKLFTTNAIEAKTFVVLTTRDRSLHTDGIDALLVEGNPPGLTINPQHGKMGMRASSTAELLFENTVVPAENLLGGNGKGFRQTMEVLTSSRIAIAAQCVGLAQAAYEASVEYATQREAFGKKLSHFQSIQWTIVDMATSIEAARLLVYQAATLKDKGKPYAKEASMAKLYASRVAVETSDKAMQIHGGTGYFAPTKVERLYRDSKVTEIYEGTSEVQRMIIARSLL